MKKSTKKFTSTLMAAASVAGVIAPATQVFAAEQMTYERAKELVDYAKKQKDFAEYNIAYAAILQLKDEAQKAELSAELAPLWNDVVTPEVKVILTNFEAVAKDKDLGSYYESYAKVEKVANARVQQYLFGELTSWGRQGVFTPEVVAATDAMGKFWKEPTEANEKAALEAIAKVGNTKSLEWLKVEAAKAGEKVDRTLKVEDVVANNLKVVTVKFNKDVDKDTLGSVKIGTKTIAKKLVDSKTLVIELATPLAQSDKVTVTVEGVKDLAGKEIAKYEKEVTVVDTNLPELVAAKALNAKQIELQFTEPVNFNYPSYTVLNDIKLDGVAVIAKATPNNFENKVVLELPTNLKTGTQKLSVANIADYANFKIASKDLSIEVAEDNAAPEIVSAEAKNKSTVRVTFNEKVETQGTFTINGNSVVATPVAESNGTQFDLAYTLDLGAVVEVRIEYKGQKDVAGNEVKDAKKFSFKVSDDTAIPTVTAAVGDANKVTLTFSKTMKTTDGTIKVLDKDKKEVASLLVSGLTFKTDTNNTVLELTASQLNLLNIDAADYTINIKGMKDNTVRENPLPEQNILITAKDSKAPVVSGGYVVKAGTLTGTDAGKDDTITIFFNEAMDDASLRNLSNYTVGTAALSTISGAAIKEVSGDAKKVVITYPNASGLTTQVITLNALKDKAGNMIAVNTPVSKNTNTAIALDTAPAVTATAKNEIVVKFNTAVKSVDPSVIKVQKWDSTLATPTFVDYAIPVSATVDSSDNTKVKFVLNKNLDTATGAYRILDNNSQLITNIYDDSFKVTSGSSDAADLIGAQSIADKISAELVSVRKSSTTANVIEVKFTEGLTSTNTNALEYDLKVKDLTDSTELGVDDFTTTVVGDTILVAINTTVTNHKFSVELLNGRYVTDLATNKVITFTAQTVKTADGTAEATITNP